MSTPIEIVTKNLNLENGKSILVVEFNGQLDETNVDSTAPAIYKLIEETPNGTSFLFDLENLTYLNSKSIGYLSDWYQKITGKGGTLVIAQARENIADILKTVGLDHIITLYFTMDEAKVALSAL